MNSRALTLANTLFSSVGIYTEYFLGMLTSIIIARHLGPDEFGAYSVVIWLVATGVAVTNSGAASAAIKFVAELRGANRPEMIQPLLRWLRRAQLGFLAVVLVAGALLFLRYGRELMPGLDQRLLLALLVLTTCLRAAYMFNIGIAKGYENFRVTAVIAMIVTPVNLLLVLAAWWFDGPMEVFLGVFTVTSLAFWWASRRAVRRLLPVVVRDVPLDADLRRRVRRYTAMVAITVTVSFVTASEVEMLFLSLYDSAAAAGHFKVAFQLASGAALLVPGVFGALLLPMMASALSQGREVAGRKLAASTTYLALLAAPLVAFGIVFAAPVIVLLYGSAYAPAAPAFAVCLAAVSASTLSQGASGYLLGADRQKALMLVVMAGAAIKILLDVVLIVRYGLEGAIVAFCVTSVIVSAALIALALRASGASLPWARLLRIAIAAGLAALAGWPLAGRLPPLAALALGGIVVLIVYVVASVVLRCWSAADLRHLRELHLRFARGRPRVLGRMLVWAEGNAGAVP
jgi:O-antigen/teichoic acid export membrane protein